MIVDASALLAVVLEEPDQDRFLDAILEAGRKRMSVANWLEAAMVVDGGSHSAASGRFDRFLLLAGIELSPVSEVQAGLAREAFRLFGRGRHPARLNFGDCFAYALARDSGESLLFKGGDFSRTDIEPALKD